MADSRAWFETVAESVEQRVRATKPGATKIVCASGISPSGTIHLGNLREVFTAHSVAEELKRRGWTVDHLHSWDDFDRLRKVPVGVPESFAEHIGRPLSATPDPWGEFPSYADRYVTEFENALRRIGITMRGIRQSVAYRSGIYRDSIKHAMARRLEIFDILKEYQTPGLQEIPEEQRRQDYYPFRVYCHACGRDATQVTDYVPESAQLSYTCSACRHSGTFSLDDEIPGKLVWKVDWPMRWAFEGVDFEPGGEDHSSPGSSFTVGQRIVREVFGVDPPYYVGYAFVGVAGQTKISSSTGTTATPAAALDILEPCILRWLYARRVPSQAFTIQFGQEVIRVYDEWDRFGDLVRSGQADAEGAHVHDACIRTSAGAVTQTECAVPFRVLAAAADITQGNLDQVVRIAKQHVPPGAEDTVSSSSLEPRLSCAIAWMTRYVPDEERTHVRTNFDHETWATLGETARNTVQLLLERLGDDWSLEGLTRLLYGVPKLALGRGLDDPPDPEIKKAQREFFIAIYSLMVGTHTGPRLPTLLLSLGQPRVRDLLTASLPTPDPAR